MAIDINSAQVLATSAANAIKRAKNNGKLDMGPIALYNLIAYYAWYTKGIASFNKEHLFLLNKLADIRYQYPDDICNFKPVLPINVDPSTPTVNTPPTVADKAIDILGASSYQFTAGDFLTTFADAENDTWYLLDVSPNVNSGTDGTLSLTVGGPQITTQVQFDLTGLTTSTLINLYYTRIDLTAFGPDAIPFRVSDDNANSLYSAEQNVNVSATLADGATNQPATIGDNTIYVANRVETIITLAMLTTGLTPPYNDPESDLIDAIRIDEISTANVGKFYINAVEAQVNDIITREDLIAKLLTHDGPDQDAINSDVFNFSARDEGSQIWVQ